MACQRCPCTGHSDVGYGWLSAPQSLRIGGSLSQDLLDFGTGHVAKMRKRHAAQAAFSTTTRMRGRRPNRTMRDSAFARAPPHRGFRRGIGEPLLSREFKIPLVLSYGMKSLSPCGVWCVLLLYVMQCSVQCRVQCRAMCSAVRCEAQCALQCAV